MHFCIYASLPWIGAVLLWDLWHGNTFRACSTVCFHNYFLPRVICLHANSQGNWQHPILCRAKSRIVHVLITDSAKYINCINSGCSRTKLLRRAACIVCVWLPHYMKSGDQCGALMVMLGEWRQWEPVLCVCVWQRDGARGTWARPQQDPRGRRVSVRAFEANLITFQHTSVRDASALCRSINSTCSRELVQHAAI